jgi:pyridoxine kinase
VDNAGKAYPLLASIQNSVGFGFLGNDAVAAVANPMQVRTIYLPTSFASGRGGLDGRAQYALDPSEFRRGMTFIMNQRPTVMVIGYLPKVEYVRHVVAGLADYTGLVVLDPVLGSYDKGLYVSVETARAIRDELMPHAQVVTPNRFEAEILLDLAREPDASERRFLDGFAKYGPETSVITSFSRDQKRGTITTLFSNGYDYERIHAPYIRGFPGYGAGDVFTATIGAILSLGGSPYAATLMAATMSMISVRRTTGYGGATVDPMGAREEFRPRGHFEEDADAKRFCERFGVRTERVPVLSEEAPRLKFAPPKNKIQYG